MASISQRDIDALRKGIEQQVRDEVTREHIKRSFDRDREKPMVEQRHIAFRRVDDLRPGDQLVEAHCGEYFRAAETIESIEYDPANKRAYTVTSRTPNGGTCLRAREPGTLFLVGRS